MGREAHRQAGPHSADVVLRGVMRVDGHLPSDNGQHLFTTGRRSGRRRREDKTSMTSMPCPDLPAAAVPARVCYSEPRVRLTGGHLLSRTPPGAVLPWSVLPVPLHCVYVTWQMCARFVTHAFWLPRLHGKATSAGPQSPRWSGSQKRCPKKHRWPSPVDRSVCPSAR